MAVNVGGDLFFRWSFGVEDERVVVPFAGGGAFEEDGVDGGAATKGRGEVRTGCRVGVDEESAVVFVEVRRELHCKVVVGAVGAPLHPELDRELMRAREVNARAGGARGAVEQRRGRGVSDEATGFPERNPAQDFGVCAARRRPQKTFRRWIRP